MKRLLALTVLAVLAACGGSGSGPAASPPGPPPLSRAEAARFLRQTTFGPTAAEIARLQSLGIAAWLDAELRAAPPAAVADLASLPAKPTQDDRVEVWFRHAVTAKDQLRERMAFALSQIFVVSERSALAGEPLALAAYYDLLAREAFGNYRDLLREVTLSPAMGVYLSMLGNQKADPLRNIRPDENYAREVLQLFSIGLVELNPDGSPKLDAGGVPLPSFDQAVVEGFAQVFTGWTFGGSPSFGQPSFDYQRPMQAFAEFHSPSAKMLLDGAVLAAGQTPEQDLEAALDVVFRHPNVGPFISRQLIQRLVTSNPSGAYVARIAAVFDDNGRGVRGDLGAVARAIVTDPEARAAPNASAGKLTEPLLLLTALWRAYDGKAPNGRFLVPGVDFALGQGPLRSPSVFNFYRPDFAPAGEMRTLKLVAPEMQITNEFQSAMTANVLAFAIFGSLDATDPSPARIRVNLDLDAAAAADSDRLVSAVAERLTGGAISPELRAAAVGLLDRYPATASAARTAEALHALITSPEYAVLH